MEIKVYSTTMEMAEAAAQQASEVLRSAIVRNGNANFIAATGASQFEFLKVLTADKSIDWSRTTMFHLDEYVGISEEHPASFRKYLKERLLRIVRPAEAYLLEGDAPNASAEARRISGIISGMTIDVAFVGVGENGHLAFNDPPADFETDEPYIIVDLDEACRLQQVGEGWFKTVDDVPSQAISMSVRQIMKSETIIAVVPHARKAEAVKNCFKDREISTQYPASILKKHPGAFVYLDQESGSLLDK
ncbi:MAG: 6-phosphogluconolactonase [Fidelibacterota bacterium]|nr:MAG: 6-phosphogluconolactonase [Candidatus Neomarinimicrobiota bacterium]